MDPTNRGQDSGAPTPDPWAQPQQPTPQDPGQPWGGPPQPPQPEQPPVWTPGAYDPNAQPAAQPPAWSQPAAGYDPNAPQYGQQPYGQQPYGQPPYGQPPAQPYGVPPAWGVAAAPARKSMLPRIVGGIVVLVVVVIGLGLAASVLSPEPAQAGQVIFTKEPPTEEGAKTCHLGTEVTSVNVGDPAYATFFFNHKQSNETVTLTILKDGSQIQKFVYGTGSDVNGLNCVEDSTNLADILTSAGSYEFKFTNSKGEVVSDGTITLK